MKNLYLFIFMCFAVGKAYGAYTYTWTGGTSTVWELAGNWNRAGSGGTSSYPGQSGTTDIVQIGVGTFFTKQPSLSSAVTIASLTIGTQTNTTLTDNGTLTVGGDITLQNNSNAGGITYALTGTGSISCTNFYLGDSTAPPAPFLGLANATYLTTLNFTGLSLSVSQNLYLTTTASKASLLIVIVFVPAANVNNPVFNFKSGTITIGNQLQTVDTNDANVAGFLLFGPASSSAQFLVNPATGNTSALNLNGANALNLDGNAGYVDFYGSAGGTATVTYNASVNQEVYTSTTPYSFTRVSPTGLDESTSIYQNLSFTGALNKTADGGNLTVGNNFTLSGTDSVDLAVNNPTVTVGGNMTINNGTKLKQGSGSITISGALSNAGILSLGSGGLNIAGAYTNTGTYAQTTGTTLFNGALAQSMQDASTLGTVFHTVNFSGAGQKTLTSGSFYVASTSVLTMIGSSKLAANGNLTLNSDASGSASVAAVSGTNITGNVNVQRYLTGGNGYRAYRMLSSPVTQGNGNYSINYLINSCYLTGTTGVSGGFDKTGNPTVYLFRENLAPLYTTFLNSNFRGINTISGSPNYLIDGDAGTFNIPVGNGFLFFFRGDRNAASLAAETTTTYVPTSTTLTATGVLNQGSYTVSDWYTPGSTNLGYTNTAGNSSVKGFNLVGNPYPSSIDWDTFSNTVSGAPIYGSAATKSIYVFDPSSKNYGVYKAGTPSKTGTNNSTNIIASGLGFFVKDTCSCGKLTFTEAAKVTTQVTGLSLLMGKPADLVVNDQHLRLQLAQDTVNTEDILINFDSSASAKFVEDEDATYKLGQGKVSLSSFSSDGVALAINELPLPQQSIAIGLNVNTQSNGIYRLALKEISEIPQAYSIWLMDSYKKDSLDMRQNGSYSFNVYKNDSTSFGATRFSLVIRQIPSVNSMLLAFNATKMPNTQKVQLTWQMQGNANISHFTIERSTDNGHTYNVIGGVVGGDPGTYSLLDKTPAMGRNLYRLRLEDANNVISYSQVVPVSFSDIKINIYPNPVVNTLNVAVASQAAASTSYRLELMNSSGIMIKEFPSAQPSWQVGVGGLQTGTYFVKVLNDTNQSVISEGKFVKM